MTVPSFARWKPKRGTSAVRYSSSTNDYGASGLAFSPDVKRTSTAARHRSTVRPANLITMITPIRPGGQRLIRRFFDTVRHFPAIKQPLQDLALIRAAHWTVIEELPDGQGEAEPIRPAYLLFESTYDVELSEYIDVFARKLPWQMRAIWGMGYGYPGVLPSSAFLRWVEDHRFTEHAWRAYPEATTRMVASGLRVAERLRIFETAVARCTDEEFAFEFRRLLIELQEDLS